MAETDLTPEEAAADARLPLYNVGDYDPVTNEFGFDNDGHTVNQMRQARDAGVIGRLARRLAIYVSSLVALTAEDASNTKADRIATSQDVVASAGNVALSQNQADRARDEANRAASYGNPNRLTPQRLFQISW